MTEGIQEMKKVIIETGTSKTLEVNPEEIVEIVKEIVTTIMGETHPVIMITIVVVIDQGGEGVIIMITEREGVELIHHGDLEIVTEVTIEGTHGEMIAGTGIVIEIGKEDPQMIENIGIIIQGKMTLFFNPWSALLYS